MEFKTISDTENALFNRREIEGDIHTDIAPSREEVRNVLSEKFSVEADAIKIRTIRGRFGSKVFLIVANIYKSKEEMDKIELRKKKDIESGKKAEETPEIIEEKTEEGSAEQPTEPKTPEDSSLTDSTQSSDSKQKKE